MVNAEVLVIAEIDQAVVAAPAIGVEDGLGADLTANNGLERGLGGIRDDFGVDLISAFEQTKDDGFAARAPAPLAAHATRAEIGFVGLQFPGKGGVALAFSGDVPAQAQEHRVNRADRNAGEMSGLGGG